MTLFNFHIIKKQNSYLKKVTVMMTSITTIAPITCAFITFMSLSTLDEVVAQSPYLSSKISSVSVGNHSVASAFCNDGDGMISGGYVIGFLSTQSVADTMVYSNHPTQEINNTGYFEGWEAGLVNTGNQPAKITATVLCLNLTLTS